MTSKFFTLENFWERYNRQKSLVLIVISGLLGVLVSIYSIGDIGFRSFIDNLQSINAIYILLIITIKFGFFAIQILIWYSLLRIIDARISPIVLIFILFIGNLFNIVVGILLQLLLLRLHCRKNIFSLLQVITLASFLKYIILALLSIPGLVIFSDIIQSKLIFISIMILILLGHAALLALISIIREARKDFKTYISSRIIIPSLLSLLLVLFILLENPLIFKAFGVTTPFLLIIIFIPFVIFGTSFPAALFGVIGTKELLFKHFLEACGSGISLENLLKSMVTHFCFEELSTIIFGILSCVGFFIYRLVKRDIN